MEMLSYLCWQNIKEIRRTPKVFAVVILTLCIGMAGFASCITLLQSITQEPLPGKGERVFRVSINNWPSDEPFRGELPPYMPYSNAKEVMTHETVKHSALLYSSYLFVSLEKDGEERFWDAGANATTVGFFDVMDYQFQYGGHWQQDTALRDVVISHDFNEQLFNGENSVGRQLKIKGETFSVSGVLAPTPVSAAFYRADFHNSVYFEKSAQLFLPLETAIDISAAVNGNMSSHGRIDSMADVRTKPVFFLHFWLEFENLKNKELFAAYLHGYTEHLKTLGAHPHEITNQMHDVQQWSLKTGLIDQRVMALGVASALLLLASLFNASSVTVNRFQHYHGEFKLRRALGASRGVMLLSALVMMMLMTAIVVLPTLLLSYIFIGQLGTIFNAYEWLTQFDGTLVLTTALLSIVSVFACFAVPYGRNIFSSIDRQLSV